MPKRITIEAAWGDRPAWMINLMSPEQRKAVVAAHYAEERRAERMATAQTFWERGDAAEAEANAIPADPRPGIAEAIRATTLPGA